MALGQCNPQLKILWHLDRVQEWKNTGETSPILFEIDPTNKCNHNCPWCSFSKWRSINNDFICLEKLKEIIDSLVKMDVKAVNWTGGGEPLMNPYLMDVVEYAHKKGIDQGIFTNGALLNKKKAEILSKNMAWVRVSVDGYDDKSYAKSHATSENSFSKVLENIRYLSSLKNRCVVGVGFIINEANYRGIVDFTKIVRDLGADYVHFKPEIRRPGNLQINPIMYMEKIKPLVDEAEKLSDGKFNVMVTYYRFNDIFSPETNYGRNYKKCLSHYFQGAIAADSKVYVCDHHKGEKEYELGDLKENNLEEIWASNKRKNVIDWLNSTDLKQCQACCRNHELNKFLWHVKNIDERMHPNHI